MAEGSNLIGKKFSTFTVISRVYKTGKTSTGRFWLCECECGRQEILSSGAITKSFNRRCACSVEDLTGQRFGRYVVVEDPLSRVNGVKVKCKCDCGAEVDVYPYSLQTGKSVSCGCHRADALKSKDPVLPHIRDLISRYKRGAAERDLHFLLTEQDIREFIGQPCFYCGAPAIKYKGYINHRKKELRKAAKQNKYSATNLEYYIKNAPFLHGIDRVENTIGYVKENCVPCCHQCNYAKSDHIVEEFVEWLSRISLYFNENHSIFSRKEGLKKILELLKETIQS